MNHPNEDAWNRSIELHDSVVRNMVVSADTVDITLECVIHGSFGRPGVDEGRSWRQEAMVRFGNASINERVPLPSEIADGSFWIDGTCYENHIPIPPNGADFKLQLILETAVTLEVVGSSCDIKIMGEILGEESFPGS